MPKRDPLLCGRRCYIKSKLARRSPYPPPTLHPCIDHLSHSSGGVGEAVEARKLQSQAVAAKVESFSRQKVKSRMWQQAAICALLISSGTDSLDQIDFLSELKKDSLIKSFKSICTGVRGVSIAKESSASVAVQFGQELLLDCDFAFDKEEVDKQIHYFCL